jgi:hypothetical protein
MCDIKRKHKEYGPQAQLWGLAHAQASIHVEFTQLWVIAYARRVSYASSALECHVCLNTYVRSFVASWTLCATPTVPPNSIPTFTPTPTHRYFSFSNIGLFCGNIELFCRQRKGDVWLWLLLSMSPCKAFLQRVTYSGAFFAYFRLTAGSGVGTD